MPPFKLDEFHLYFCPYCASKYAIPKDKYNEDMILTILCFVCHRVFWYNTGMNISLRTTVSKDVLNHDIL